MVTRCVDMQIRGPALEGREGGSEREREGEGEGESALKESLAEEADYTEEADSTSKTC